MVSTYLAPLLVWTGLMVSLYLAFNPWTLKSMGEPGPARRLRQATLAGEGFYTFHEFAITSLQRFISRSILMDDVLVSALQSRQIRKRTHLKPFGITAYLNVNAFETMFLFAQGYTTLTIFLSLLFSGRTFFLETQPAPIGPPASTIPSGAQLSIWFVIAFTLAAILFPALLDRSKGTDQPYPTSFAILNDMLADGWIIVIFSTLLLIAGTKNEFSAVWISTILAGVMLYACSRGVLFTAMALSSICQMIVYMTSSSTFFTILALGLLMPAQYKFARAHGFGPVLRTVQTRRFSWVYFISLHMSAPILVFTVSGRTAKPYYLTLLVFVLIPLINSIIDWLSVAITRYLMEVVKRRAHSLRVLFLYLLIDALVAIVISVAMLFLILTLFAHMNRLQQEFDTSLLIPVIPILETLRDNPSAPEIGWMTFMLLMTVVPTLIHYLIVWFSIGIWTAAQIVVAIDKRFGLRLWVDEASGEVNWDKLQAAASLHTAMLLTIVWFVGTGLWVVVVALELLLKNGATAFWRGLIDDAAQYYGWLSASSPK